YVFWVFSNCSARTIIGNGTPVTFKTCLQYVKQNDMLFDIILYTEFNHNEL
ncbi:hypothetical protein L9F63_028135, partial [Diploptera punctata]